ncbi:MAG: hypothetical protein ACP5DY_02080 [Thermovirgaceae bacterium]
MKDFSICLQNHDGQKPGSCEKVENVRVNVNLKRLEEQYSKKSTGARKAFDSFMEFWRSPTCDELLHPRGQIGFVPLEILLERFGNAIESGTGPDFKESLEKSSKTALMAWTIGDAIEKKVTEFSKGGNNLKALLIDVAASLLLNEMHLKLREIVRESAKSAFGLYPMLDHYPGGGRKGSELIPAVFNLTSASKVLGIHLNDHNIMHPRKSECSILLLGDEERELQNTPCTPCLGKRCLYYQLGGCHAPDKVDEKVTS